MRLILLGPPGSGKGTQGAMLAERIEVPAISTGDLFRKNLSEKTELGKKAQGYMEKGQLVPDELVIDMVSDRLDEADADVGFILDGFPRTIPQADGLRSMLDGRGLAMDHVVLVDVADEAIVERLSSRRTCSECGAIYNILLAPPKQDGVCDKCGAKDSLTQRADDVAETIRERLNVYHDQTEPLIAYYQEAALLRKVDGSKDPADVLADVVAAVSD